MIFVLIPLALLAGAGVGFGYGIHFARQDQTTMFDLITVTTDKLTTSALFPGLKGAIEQRPEPEDMFAEPEGSSGPEFLRESGEDPWNYLEDDRALVDG